MTAPQTQLEKALITLTTDIVSAHVGNNNVAVGNVPALISSVYMALSTLGEPAPKEDSRPEPAVSVRSSVKPDYIVCLEDGKKLKMLKRYLRTHYDMSPEKYRERWNLPADYPMIAPSYAKRRREIAAEIGLGRRMGETRPKGARKAS